MASPSTKRRVRRALPRSLQRLERRIRGWPDYDRMRADGADIHPSVFIAQGSFLDPDFVFLISIGERAVLSVDVMVLAHDASTKRLMGKTRVAPVRIGARAFIGARAIILPGVEIGDDAVVGAGSVVRHSVPAGAVAAGNPARIIADSAPSAERHGARLAEATSWPRQGWTASTGITPERIAEMRAALADGEGYIL
jgi:maltose O-acetyltransferase